MHRINTKIPKNQLINRVIITRNIPFTLRVPAKMLRIRPSEK